MATGDKLVTLDGLKEVYDNVQEDLGDLKSAINDIHQIPEGGSSGQILTKVSGSDYDVQWSPVGMPSDAQVDSAVADWLDDHPDATTTVEDGAITMPKLSSALQEKIVIRTESDAKYYHDKKPNSVTFIPDEKANVISAKYADCENLIGGLVNVGTRGGLSISKSGRFCMVKGEATGGLMFFDTSSANVLNKLAGKTLHWYYHMKKETGFATFTYVFLRVNGTTNLVKSYYSGRNTLLHETITFPAEVTSLMLKIDDLRGSVFSEGDCAWYGLYEHELIDTDHIIGATDPQYEITDIDVNHIDTAMHMSTIEMIESTKEYVDNHVHDIKAYWTENIYVLPEHFGAVGDGTTDDTTALQNSVNYAIQHLKPLRGFGKYKITSPLTLFAQNMDYMINEIVYTGTDAAVKASGNDNKYEFNKITSGGIGFLAMKNGNSGFSYNVVVIKNIDAQSHAICFTGNGDSVFMLYNTFHVRRASSANGDVYHGGDGAVAQENTYYDTSCACPNGWAVNACHGKMYNFTMESNVLNGIRLVNAQGAEFVGFRHREMTDKLVSRINGTDQRQGGTLIKFVGACSNVFFSTCDWIPYAAIDVADATPISEMNVVYAAYAQGLITIDAMIRYGNISSANGVYNVGRRMYVLGNKKICVPAYESVVENIYSPYDMRDDAVEANQAKVHPTKMIIGVDDSVIYLSTSYCSIGYSEFIVDQTDHLCTIYDCDDTTTPIFNGQQLGSGVYKLHAYCDVVHSGYGQQSDQVRMNTGTNDLWEITKLS